MDLYAENILDHYRHPRGKTSLKNPTHSHKESNPSCGDDLEVQLVIEGNVIKEMGWSGTGCAISQAAMSLLFEELEGKTIDDILSLSKEDILDMLGVPVSARRMNCALLCLHTVQNAICLPPQ